MTTDKDPAKSESIYKAVKRLLENNGLGRAQLEAIVSKAPTLEAAQLAAEDALRAIAAEILRAVGA